MKSTSWNGWFRLKVHALCLAVRSSMILLFEFYDVPCLVAMFVTILVNTCRTACGMASTLALYMVRCRASVRSETTNLLWSIGRRRPQ